MTPTQFTTRSQAGEINRRLKRAGYKSTAELCYNYVRDIVRHFGGDERVKKICLEVE